MKTKCKRLGILGNSLVIVCIAFLLSYNQIYSQCNLGLITIEQCDMENVDFNTDGAPDGIINLYTETGTTTSDGIWMIDPKFDTAFDATTGNLSMWDLKNSTVMGTENDYFFELKNATCGDEPFRTARLILGPYSGVALPSSGPPLDVNGQGCDGDIFGFDLFTVFALNSEIPSPHLNGVWSYNGTSPNFVGVVGSRLFVEIPNDPVDLVDQEVFELTYTVSGTLGCSGTEQTTVRIAMVRQVESGISEPTEICEDDILAGVYDVEIDLRDDQYLREEDEEGIWLTDLDPTGEIENEIDSRINLRTIYNDLIDSGNNLRFGCETYDFVYSVEDRSAVCMDQTTTVSFTIYEQLRPFSQPNPTPRVCRNAAGTLNLFDQLDFTTTGTTNFVYDDSFYVNWRLVSGPSNLGLIPQPDRLEDFNPSIDYYLGTINLSFAPAGIYTFEYGVTPDINCPSPNQICDPYAPPGDPTFSQNPCDVLTARVTIEILPFDYTGEDTSDINLCSSLGSVDLRSLLETNGIDPIVDTGVWTNSVGDVIDNNFVFPTITTSQDFSFTYTTTTSEGCIESSKLDFTIDKLPDAGEGSDAAVCSDELTITLFDLLEGEPDTTGIWTGPFGYISTDHLGVFDASDDMLPILGPGIYTYTVPANTGCPDADEATVNITLVTPEEIGTDRSETFCKLDGRVNLFSLLDRDTTRTGTFEDTDNTEALSADGVLEFETLTNGIYNFRYVVTNTLPCDQSSLIVSVQIVDLPIPVVPDPEFCILDAKRLDDVEVDVLNFNWYDTLESEIPIVDNPILLDNQVYYIANVDADNCESERLRVTITILNTGERSSTGELCTLDFQDGVSPNGDNQNDTFDLRIDEVYNLPEAFPDFDLKIFNRYGSLVYEGRRDTQEFRGESNTSVRLGDDLPSGTYFYIFTPNFENNLPIQGSIYLSR
ncbi:gliding motility-associated C-terminal domain-containing protein [Aquimarina sp. AD10]|uniref:gliding motility-associated C-terminal domain-containing protein n=1 Tax=Aquimarina sp. AD10 TaxID=1714849 RepID=UPI001F3627C3|nr:gliding motility-associated C-terminal domain-containing protein [Aquimarina sp. AD10]